MSDNLQLLAEVTTWAAEHRDEPPPAGWARARITEAELLVLFNRTTSAAHHLALVDLPRMQRAIATMSKTHPVRAMIKQSWQRHHAAARDIPVAPLPVDPRKAEYEERWADELAKIRAGMRGEIPLEDAIRQATGDARWRVERNKLDAERRERERMDDGYRRDF